MDLGAQVGLSLRMLERLRETPFVSHPLLFNGHLQSVFGSQQRRSFPYGWQSYIEDVVTLEDRTMVRYRLVTRDSAAPTVILVHGMSGSFDSGYMQGLSHKAFSCGWNAVLLSLYDTNQGKPLPRIFHAGASEGLRLVIEAVAAKHRLQTLMICGVSLGGNILLKMLGELGESSQLDVKAAAAVSPLIDLTSSWKVFDLPSNWLYKRYYVNRLRELTLENSERVGSVVDLERLERVKSIKEFDEVVTVPLTGFDGVFDYYEQASSSPWLGQIRIPTFVVHSKDDPLLPSDPLRKRDVRENPFLLVHLTTEGGHVAFLERHRSDVDRSWAENRTIDFLKIAVD